MSLYLVLPKFLYDNFLEYFEIEYPGVELYRAEDVPIL